MGLLIILVADQAYQHFLDIIIRSIMNNSPKSIRGFHIHLVNNRQYQAHLEELVNDQFDLEFSYSDLELDDTKIVALMNNSPLKITQKKCYCANIRIKVIHDLLVDNRDKLLYFLILLLG